MRTVPLLVTLFAILAMSSNQVEAAVEKPLRVRGRSPVEAKGNAILTKSSDGVIRIEVPEFVLTGKPRLKPHTIVSFQIGHRGPERRRNRYLPITDDPIAVDVALAAGETYTSGVGMLVGELPAEEGARLEDYEVWIAVVLRPITGNGLTRFNLTTATDEELTESTKKLLELRQRRREFVKEMSLPYEQLRERYLKDLEKHEGYYSRTDNLEGERAVKSERKSISRLNAITDVRAHEELQQTQSLFVKSREALANEALPKIEDFVKQQYDEALELQEQGAAEGDVNYVQIVQREARGLDEMIRKPYLIPKRLNLAFVDANAQAGPLASQAPATPENSPLASSVWDSDREIGPGDYTHTAEKIVISPFGKEDPGPVVGIKPGTTLRNTQIFVERGKLEFEYSMLFDSEISCALHGRVVAKDSIFDRTNFSKGGGWFVKLWSAKFEIDNCMFYKSLFKKLSITDYGLHMTNSTVLYAQIPSLKGKKDPIAQVGLAGFRVSNCKFIACEIPVSFLVMTEDCVFFGCTFIDDADVITDPRPVSVSVFISESSREVPTTAAKQITINVERDALPDAGSSLKYKIESGRLRFLY